MGTVSIEGIFVNQGLKVAMVYCFPPVAGQHHWEYACRFIENYVMFPPDCEHDSYVVVNGGKLTSEISCMFSPLRNLHFLRHDDSGWDIGAYQMAAWEIECDMILFFSGSTWFKRRGWLARMVQAYLKHGDALYGCMGNRGDLNVKVWPHIRTTAFWMHPNLMRLYPYRIRKPEDRHPFEHGPYCLTSFVKLCKLHSYVVTWKEELLWEHWDDPVNGFHRGNQSDVLALDRMCEPPYYHEKTNRNLVSLPILH